MRHCAKLYGATWLALLMMAASVGAGPGAPKLLAPQDLRHFFFSFSHRDRVKRAAGQTHPAMVNPPAYVSAHPERYVITVRIKLARDHRLIGRPEVLTNGDGPLFEAVRDSVVRAAVEAQPYDMLSLSAYNAWKEIDINFDPREVATPSETATSVDERPPLSAFDRRPQLINPKQGVSLKKEGGIFVVPVEINGAMTLEFAVDSGATYVAVPADVFSTLKRTGIITNSILLGSKHTSWPTAQNHNRLHSRSDRSAWATRLSKT